MDQSRLRELESQCIQEHAPPCTAACPLHIDVRALLAEASKGDFDKALQILKKRLPFPGIIGRICEQPCRTVCNRKDSGDAIAIAALERACADFGEPTAKKSHPVRRQGKRVAVIGGGLSGTSAALYLARKGHTVVLCEAQDRLGGRLWDIPKVQLPHEMLQAEMATVTEANVEVRLNTHIDIETLKALQTDFDAIYLGVGNGPYAEFTKSLLEKAVDPVSFATTTEGIFAGGSAITAPPTYINSISTGWRAALSIDRYLQNVSLTNSRDYEAPYTTRLYTSLENTTPETITPMNNPLHGYTQEEAIREAQRCIQCECMECVKVCTYLEHYGSYPKQYVRQIYNNLSIVMGTRLFNTLINTCSLCGLCGEVCPEDLNMATVCREARQLMVAQGRMPPSAHDFALRDMAFSNSHKFTLARQAPGTEASEYVFFPGCQLSASAPGQVEAVYSYLREKLNPNIALMLRCCGAPADWAGRSDLFETALAELQAAHTTLGKPKVILACSTCYQIFKTHMPDIEIVSLWKVLDGMEMPTTAAATTSGPLAIHDPCTTRYETPIQDSVRNLLNKIQCPVEELPLNREKTECCSYGGLMWFTNREVAQKTIQRRIQESATDYVTYCAMCRDFFASQGKRTLHLLDLLFPTGDGDPADRPNPGYSTRHENRARLKRKLLNEIWGETMAKPTGYETIKLDIPNEVLERMEERCILVEDVQQVIEFAMQTGQKLLDPETGHFLTHYKPASVTYWVEYSIKEDVCIIHNAYSHRMEIVEDITA